MKRKQIIITALIITLFAIQTSTGNGSASDGVITNQFDTVVFEREYTLTVAEPCDVYKPDNFTVYNNLMNGSIHPSEFTGTVEHYDPNTAQYVMFGAESELSALIINKTNSGTVETVLMPKFEDSEVLSGTLVEFDVPEVIDTKDSVEISFTFDHSIEPGPDVHVWGVFVYFANYTTFEFAAFPNLEFHNGDTVGFDLSEYDWIHGETDILFIPMFRKLSEPGKLFQVGAFSDTPYTVQFTHIGRNTYLYSAITIAGLVGIIIAVSRILSSKKYEESMELMASRYQTKRNIVKKKEATA